ncbi:uncharacterized protein LOC133547811 [Nerophis ophidion]|uniref:uncharacterized protein LOC133547811 n=1 Tax=Nerophis ophidion TaxID=159077 RepID=UPI002AE0A2B4|nr:uncharacterized protein LOC133547811 [Nerophis ophidion]
MCERTIAEYEEELCPTKEEKERPHQKPQVVLHRTDVQQPPHIKEEEENPQPPHIKEEEENPQPPHIKEEEEEVWMSQEGECPVGQEEADVSKFPLTVVSVKTEEHEDKPPESSQLHHSPSKHNILFSGHSIHHNWTLHLVLQDLCPLIQVGFITSCSYTSSLKSNHWNLEENCTFLRNFSIVHNHYKRHDGGYIKKKKSHSN